MSDTVETVAAPHRRPNYLYVFAVLTVLTVVEVFIAYTTGAGRVPLLLITSFVKASAVIAYYMHLRYDSRWFLLIWILPFALVIPLLLTIYQ